MPPRRERWLTAQEAADRLRVKRKTLYNWASTWEVDHRGPQPHRLGSRALRYRESEVDSCLGL
ncbi:helix-turn-helix domain-containing protein [Streptomyces sp. NPDC051985]|uniref:helix-turn-helix transcriptional regulator n=1 Tax=Streptomyces sp. NPDC051985 TaxID=3155807 RepID=UPI003443B819